MSVPSTLELKSTLEQLKKGLDEAVSRKAPLEALTKLQTQVDAIDLRLAQKHISDQPESTLEKSFREDDNILRLLRDKKGHAVVTIKGRDVAELMQRKSIITAVTTGNVNGDPLAPVGVSTAGVLPIDMTPGIVAEARQPLKIRGPVHFAADDNANRRFH